MRFDWYAATIREDPDAVVGLLADNLAAEVESTRPKNGYHHGRALRRDGSTVASVMFGGPNGWPHAWASGDDTDAFVPVVRSAWPTTHRVSRMDAAEDFDGRGTWDRLYGECLTLADERSLKIDQAGDWHRFEAGRTFYLGGRSSAVRARLYEKGKQINGRQEPGSLAPRASDDLVRLEVQVRPDGPARDRAAAGSASDAFGYSEWTRELARRVMVLEVERVHIRERRQTDDDRAIGFLVQQYGEHLERLAYTLGGWGQVGDYLAMMRRRQQEATGR